MARVAGSLILATVLLAGCSGVEQTTPDVDTVGCDATPASAGEFFTVKFETTKGDVLIDVHPDWAPLGAAHFKELVESGYFTDIAFFRCIPGFMVQFGISGDPGLNQKWDRTIKDDPVIQSNSPGFLTYAKTGMPNSRSTQLFINLGDNANLDADKFAPIGKVRQGMDVVKSINMEYRERPNQGQITNVGSAYLKAQFPKLDYIKKATIISGGK